jgi:uncharacterized membrane protein
MDVGLRGSHLVQARDGADPIPRTRDDKRQVLRGRACSYHRRKEVIAVASLTKSVVVHAPVEKVCRYLDDPTRLPEIWPSLVEIKDVQSLPNGGHSNRWTYKMAGMRLEGTSEDVEHITNQRTVSKTKGGIDSTQTWMMKPESDGTKVTFQVDYTVPIPVLGKLAEAAIVKLNDHEGDAIMANLKTLLEAE